MARPPRKVLVALASSRGVDINELRSEVEDLENNKRRRKSKKKHPPTAMQSVSRMRLEDAAKYEALKVLAVRFDNKSFVASLREVRLLMEKLGMKREGLLRSNIILRGDRMDEVMYGVLREEWEQQNG